MKNKLTETQQRVLGHMKLGKWYTAYPMASIVTMRALAKKGYVESRGEGSLGSGCCPRTTIEFRRIPPEDSPFFTGKRIGEQMK